MGDRGPQPGVLSRVHLWGQYAQAKTLMGVRGGRPLDTIFENNVFCYFLPFFRMRGRPEV